MQDLYPSRNSAQAEVLPRRDPVLHGAWTASAPLNREEALQFDEQGYLVLKNVFGADEVQCLQAETSRLLADTSGLNPQTVVTEPGGDEVRSIFRIHEQSTHLARLAADERLAGVARFLLGDDVYVHQSRLNYKPGFRGKEFYWHSDFETWHVEDGMPRMRALSMSVLLAPNTPNNGPLMLMPGSHRKFVTCVGETPDDHYLTSLKKQEYGVPEEKILASLAEEHGIVAPIGEPGTVVIFDCNMMHGSNGNITPLPRSNAFIVYNAVSNRLVEPFGAVRPRPSFIAAREVRPLISARGRSMEAAI
ncbi:ectoine hydroxylase [Parvibaculum sp.]|uniref:ectoine hydroxylase n=1 Tax=Parvibaculum sp. TaxID=2024848 RepID=UPI002B5985F1|nr:ectoine hydroxylase [Parvibaculum sp.]HUD53411.1 ectoine hydroxylase [Parvibaculum sp.]